MLPSLQHLRVDQCLLADIDHPSAKKSGAKLRGPDAVFWPAGKSEEELTMIARSCYPHDKYLEYEDDVEDAMLNSQKIQNNVHSTTIPVRHEAQLLYHWTNNFPSCVKQNELIETKGYVWTSTFEGFVWNRFDRVTIIIPSDKSLDVYVDPQSHSRAHVCENSTRTHKDVVLPPSVIVLESMDSSEEERRRVAWSVLQSFVNNVWMDAKIPVTVTKDGDKWLLTTDSLENRDILYTLLRIPEGDLRVRQQEAVRLFSGAVEAEGDAVVIYLERLEIRLPVLRWVRGGTLHGS